MILNQQQLGYLKDVTDYILQFEEDMVIPRLLDESVCWKAKQLAYAMTSSNVIWISTDKTLED